MKALSLTQPYATLVAIGAKQIETRSWSTNYRGPIAIHAAKGFPGDCRALCWDHPFRAVLHDAGVVDFGGYSDLDLDSMERFPGLPLGAIVAVARLVQVCLTGDSLKYAPRFEFFLGTRGCWQLTATEAAFGDYAPGRFAWLLADVRRLDQPVVCKGALGVWTVPDDIAKYVVSACADVPGAGPKEDGEAVEQ